MILVNPYLNFAGNSEEAFTFYKSVFGGEFSALQRFKDTPEGPSNLPPGDKEKLMHVSLPLGKTNTLMATDTLESIGQKLVVGNNIHLAVEAESKEEAQKIFNGLSAGGTVSLPLQNTFWGAYFGMLKDKFGIHWMVSHTPKK